MHYFFTLILLVSIAQSATSREVREARISIMALITPLIPGAVHKTSPAGNFRIDKCEKFKINWVEVLLMQKDAVLNYSFKEGCDIEGTIKAKVLKEFPVHLKLRNLKQYTSIESSNKITVGLEQLPLLMLNMSEGKLTGKEGIVKFEADYQVQINPLNGKVEKNRGGEIRISEIYDKKVNIKEKIILK